VAWLFSISSICTTTTSQTHTLFLSLFFEKIYSLFNALIALFVFTFVIFFERNTYIKKRLYLYKDLFFLQKKKD
jgi:hypothetical protein